MPTVAAAARRSDANPAGTPAARSVESPTSSRPGGSSWSASAAGKLERLKCDEGRTISSLSPVKCAIDSTSRISSSIDA
jgi:hypothetical protein